MWTWEEVNYPSPVTQGETHGSFISVLPGQRRPVLPLSPHFILRAAGTQQKLVSAHSQLKDTGYQPSMYWPQQTEGSAELFRALSFHSCTAGRCPGLWHLPGISVIPGHTGWDGRALPCYPTEAPFFTWQNPCTAQEQVSSSPNPSVLLLPNWTYTMGISKCDFKFMPLSRKSNPLLTPSSWTRYILVKLLPETAVRDKYKPIFFLRNRPFQSIK